MANEIWKDDLLDRQQDAEFLIRFLSARVDERGARGLPRSYVLNLDAGWGKGKSYFLNRLAQQLQVDGFLVAPVNAWRDDHTIDPLLAVMSAIDQAVAPAIKAKKVKAKSWKVVKQGAASIAVTVAKGAMLHWSRKAIGESADEIMEKIGNGIFDGSAIETTKEELVDNLKAALDKKGEALIDSFREDQRTIETFRSDLSEFLALIADTGFAKVPLIVLVDELDRCRPSYAISLLERVKHLFDIDNVVFIVATDTGQLCHAIGAVYGSGFDSKKYLLRFFDQTYFFEEPSLEQFVATLSDQHGLKNLSLTVPPNTTVDSYLVGAFSFFNLSLRDVEQCIETLHNILTAWDSSRITLDLAYLLPLIIGHQQGLPLKLTGKTFLGDLEAIVRRQGRSDAWRINFGRGPDGRSVQASGLSLFSKLVGAQLESLPEIFRREESRDPVARWVHRQFEQEFLQLHKNQYRQENPPFSIFREYPQLVQTAGRLQPKFPN
ncbi:MAG: KAP family NTPase [Parvibaculum sp.]|uniref:KAP family P-loop NTPase fold protein n=1 Tax=Parvibaculum sp. TaxID=2024848 RepID=UPI0025D34095|nr:P-loop NTPase fold protein [Parvibaculum sp.]MCE9648156.1 KAP family NTPase [Parvibaculum sp.]